jgi:hypothetical protein
VLLNSRLTHYSSFFFKSSLCPNKIHRSQLDDSYVFHYIVCLENQILFPFAHIFCPILFILYFPGLQENGVNGILADEVGRYIFVAMLVLERENDVCVRARVLTI